MGNGPIANNIKTEIEGEHIVYYEFKPENNLEDNPFFYNWVEYKRELIFHNPGQHHNENHNEFDLNQQNFFHFYEIEGDK